MQVEIVIEATSGWNVSIVDGSPEAFDGLRCAYRFEGQRRWGGFVVQSAPLQSLRDCVIAAIAVVNSEATRQAA